MNLREADALCEYYFGLSKGGETDGAECRQRPEGTTDAIRKDEHVKRPT
ncbi:hypothetical protein PI124_g7676 [Phytophthora idaei]|nr:hypothetical protein PI125_g16422 [Phytophthora idaei]KAG3247617.1 hypothetical protein PI124_g7676 [Phytophthora idaei]